MRRGDLCWCGDGEEHAERHAGEVWALATRPEGLLPRARLYWLERYGVLVHPDTAVRVIIDAIGGGDA